MQNFNFIVMSPVKKPKEVKDDNEKSLLE